MATLVLSTIGRAVGGPLGALAGTLAGGALDRAVLGGGGRRPAPADLAVQGANYGDPLPRLYGTIRASGQVIWSSGIRLREGDSKTDGGRSFAASFAVALSSRPIAGVGRVWADSRLIRDAAGVMAVPGAMRVHRGLADQQPDPLIAAAEGAGGAPAYRGRAYVLFEELGLAEFGNRIPQLSFEVIADAPAPSVGAITADLFGAAGAAAPEVGALEATVRGFGVARATSLGACIEQLGLCAPLEAYAGPDRVVLRARGHAPGLTLRLGEAVAGAGSGRTRTSEMRVAGEGVPGAVSLQYLDAERDLQPGLQRATRGAGGAARTEAVPVVLPAAEAKAIAERLARDAVSLVETRSITAPLRFAALDVGDVIAVEGDARAWRVRRATVAGLVVELELEAAGQGAAVAAVAADPGRVDPNPLAGQGATTALALDLPALPWETPAEPRLLVAAGAPGPSWRRADVRLSLDGGETWRTVATASRRAVMGSADTVLGAGPADRRDEVNSVDVTLLNAEDWLQPATATSVLAGANLALLGDELLHFQQVEPLGAQRFRLRGLVRGRQGTEAATRAHVAGEPFLLLDPASLVTLPIPVTMIGGVALLKLVGPLDEEGAVAAVAVDVVGRAVLPFAPTGLAAAALPGGGVELAWVERGTAYRGWADGAGAVTGSFQLGVTSGPTTRVFAVTGDRWRATAAEQETLFGGPLADFTMRVAQVHPQAGLGDTAEARIILGA